MQTPLSACVLVLTLALGVGCASSGTPQRPPGPGPSGDVAAPATYMGQLPIDVDQPDRYTIRFGRDGRVALRADCNRGTGGYSVSADHRITFRPIALTRMMCPKGSLSNRFAKEVGRATSYFLKDGDLFLELPVDSGTLRFRRQA
jgi:heat shock protein HslJ